MGKIVPLKSLTNTHYTEMKAQLLKEIFRTEVEFGRLGEKDSE